MGNEWWVEDEASTHIEGDGWGVFDASGNLLCVCPLKITALAIASMSGMIDPYQRGFEDGEKYVHQVFEASVRRMVEMRDGVRLPAQLRPLTQAEKDAIINRVPQRQRSGYAKRLCRCIPGWLDPYCPVLGQHDYGTQRQTPSP